jgi:hypothetical protein
MTFVRACSGKGKLLKKRLVQTGAAVLLSLNFLMVVSAPVVKAETNFPPVAVPGGPYVTCPNSLTGICFPITLDASGSFDANEPDDAVIGYAWDTDGDNLYGLDDDPADYTGMIVENYVEANWRLGSTYVIRLKVTDRFGAVSQPAETTVTVSDYAPPVINPVIVSGTSSSAPIISWKYYSVQGTPQDQYRVEIAGTAGLVWQTAGTGTADSVMCPGTALISGEMYRARVVVSDGSSWVTAYSPVWVYEPNQPPVAEAGPDRTIEQTSPAGAQVILDGSGSADDGVTSPLVYDWTWSGGSADGIQPEVLLAPGRNEITLTVFDGEFTSSDIVVITVADTTSPVIPLAVSAVIDVDPGTINLKSRGGKNAFTVHIELPTGCDVTLIDISTVIMKVGSTEIAVQGSPVSTGDHDKDTVPDAMVKFNRQAVIDALKGQIGNTSLTVTGQMRGGISFTGTGSIKVINPGK